MNTNARDIRDGKNRNQRCRNGRTATCAAKANGVIIYTIFLDLNGAHGNSAPLQYCATDSTKYFDLTSTSTVVTTFNQIAQQITNVRVVR